MRLLLENAKQETRIIRIASVTITSPRIMMMGRNLSQAQDHFQESSRNHHFQGCFSPGFLLRVLSVDLKDSPQSSVYARLQPRDLCGSYRVNHPVGMMIMKVSKSFLAIAIVTIVLLMIIRMIETTSPANGDSNVRRRNISSDCCSPKTNASLIANSAAPLKAKNKQ